VTDFDVREIEKQIVKVVRRWQDDLRDALVAGFGEESRQPHSHAARPQDAYRSVHIIIGFAFVLTVVANDDLSFAVTDAYYTDLSVYIKWLGKDFLKNREWREGELVIGRQKCLAGNAIVCRRKMTKPPAKSAINS
jgi:hypothetical protein